MELEKFLSKRWSSSGLCCVGGGGLYSSEFISDENLNPSTNWSEPWRCRSNWGRLSQNFINQSITEWWQRPQAVIQNNGAHIEHLFK